MWHFAREHWGMFGYLGDSMAYQPEELLYLFIVGFFLISALDMIRRLLDARFSYEQIRPKSVHTRWVMVLIASMAMGVGYDQVMKEVKNNLNPVAEISPSDKITKTEAAEALDPEVSSVVQPSAMPLHLPHSAETQDSSFHKIDN